MTNPQNFSQLQSYVSQIESRLARLETRDLDLKGRGIFNLRDATAGQDPTTYSQVLTLLEQIPTSPATEPPQFSFAHNSALQIIPNTAFTAVTFNLNLADTGNIHSTSVAPTKFICRSKGLYLCVGHICWALSAAGTIRAVTQFINGAGTNPGANSNNLPSAAINPTNLSVGAYQLNVGDYFEWKAYQDSGGNLNLLATLSYAGIWKLG